MKHLLSRVLALVVTLSISMGSAAMFTGNHLQAYCLDQNRAVMFGQCLGFLRGVQQGHAFFRSFNDQNKFYCLPDNVTISQLLQISVTYLEENPEQLHLEAGALVYGALAKAFPCEDGQ